MGNQLYDPKGEGPCTTSGFDPRRCRQLRGTRDLVNDVLEYWFGGYAQFDDGIDPAGRLYGVTGIDAPFAGLAWGFNGPASAGNHANGSSFIATSGMLPVSEFPVFASWPSTRWAKPGGPLGAAHRDPVRSFRDRERRLQAADADRDGASVRWQFVVLGLYTTSSPSGTSCSSRYARRAPTTGRRCPTPTATRRRTSASACPQPWRLLHPHVDHYQTLNADGTCSPTGSTGAWHAATGRSDAWEQWSVDLSAYAGETVEISIAYASDWMNPQLGVLIDDVTLPDGTSTSFESDLGGWAVTGPPAGSGPNINNFARVASFLVGASITTPDTVLMGYGIEGIATPAERAAVGGRVLGHLLR